MLLPLVTPQTKLSRQVGRFTHTYTHTTHGWCWRRTSCSSSLARPLPLTPRRTAVALRPSHIRPTCAEVHSRNQTPIPRPALHVFPFPIHTRIRSPHSPAAAPPSTTSPPSNCHLQLLHFLPHSPSTPTLRPYSSYRFWVNFLISVNSNLFFLYS